MSDYSDELNEPSLWPVRITVKNYRCFSDRNPLELTLTGDNIALVGPNNSGKTTVLKFFYEFRPLFAQLTDQQTPRQLIQNHDIYPINMPAADPGDYHRHKSHDPLSIKLDFLSIPKDSEIPAIRTIELRKEPNSDRNWSHKIKWSGITPNPDANILDSNTDGFIRIRNSKDIIADYRHTRGVFEILSETRFIGSNRHVLPDPSQKHYDTHIGQTFNNLIHAFKTGSPSKKKIITDVEIEFRLLFKLNNFSVTADEKTGLHVTLNDMPLKFADLGTGLAQVFVTLVNASIDKPSILLIDEPELSLHPGLQAEFIQLVQKKCQQGVIFATHSVGLARSAATTILSVKIDGDSARLRKFESTPNFVEFLGEMNYSMYRDLGYEAILLVEGITDVGVFQVILRSLALDHRVVILPVGGDAFLSGTHEVATSEVARLGNNIFGVFDSERTSPAEALSEKRVRVKEFCATMGIQAHFMDRRAIENYFSRTAINTVYGPDLASFGPYAKPAPGWKKKRNREVMEAMDPNDFLKTDIGEFLASIKASIGEPGNRQKPAQAAHPSEQ